MAYYKSFVKYIGNISDEIFGLLFLFGLVVFMNFFVDIKDFV